MTFTAVLIYTLRCSLKHNHDSTDTHLIFSIFVFMSKPTSDCFILSFIFIVVNFITSFKRRTCCFYIFKNIYYFWVITWMKKANNFQTAKVQVQGVA